jgi:Fe-S-cluster containining protein
MCGKCCEAIHIPVDYKEVTRMANGDNFDAKFIRDNWIPISREEAFAINPTIQSNMSKAQEWAENEDADPYRHMHFYTCSKLDKEKGLCTVWQDRPKVCSGYPWYGKLPEVTMLFYSEDCGYIVDVEDAKARAKEEGDAKI